jgi:hypothetical protein
MHTVQLMKKMSDASKNVFRVYHIRIIAPIKLYNIYLILWISKNRNMTRQLIYGFSQIYTMTHINPN